MHADDSAFVLQQMTSGERSVALALADGLSNQEIADQLAKSVATVKFHAGRRTVPVRRTSCSYASPSCRIMPI